MLEGFSRQDPLRWVNVEHPLEEVDSLPRRFREHSCELRIVVAHPLVELKLGQPQVHWAVRLRGTSEHSETFGQHFVLAATHEDRSLVEHLGQDTPYRPDIDTEQVILTAEDDLGRSVPQGNNRI